MYTTSSYRGYLIDPIRFHNLSGKELYAYIKEDLLKELEAKNVPFSYSEDEVRSGGIFSPKYSMLIIRYPNPPTRFFDIGIVVNENVVSFPLLGESVQNTKINKKASLQEEGKYLQAALVKPDEFIRQKELAWQDEIVDAVDAIS